MALSVLFDYPHHTHEFQLRRFVCAKAYGDVLTGVALKRVLLAVDAVRLWLPAAYAVWYDACMFDLSLDHLPSL